MKNNSKLKIAAWVLAALIVVLISAFALAACGILPILNKGGSDETEPPFSAAETAPQISAETESTLPILTETKTSPPSSTAVVFAPAEAQKSDSKIIVVLDAGHGKSSGSMTAEEKLNSGWVYNEARGWGEWRHFKSHSVWIDCEGSGCSGRGECWYPMGNGDRDTEPEINLSTAMSTRKYLEQMGFEIRMTRTADDENPSMTKRLAFCYPEEDTSQPPDADLFVCIHSNAGGGRGSAYISLSGEYDQAGIKSNYVQSGNALGKSINDEIVIETELEAYNSGVYNDLPEAILFCKSPITIAYLEIGFFDNAADLEILKNDGDSIGYAIAEGINNYAIKCGLK